MNRAPNAATKSQYEMSLLKRFDKIQLKTPAAGLLSSVKREAPKFGLTTVVEDLAELDLSSKKKKEKESKDDFGIMLRTAERLDVEERKQDQLSEKKNSKDPNRDIAKQLNELFKEGDDLADN
jgi:hypothetical protein